MQLLQKFIKLSLFEAQNDTKPLLKINHSVVSKGRSAPFSQQTLELISSIPDADLSALSNRKGFIKWLANAVEGAQRPPSRQQIRYVVDFINGTNVDVSFLKSFDDAHSASQQWHAELGSKTDDNVQHRDDVNVIHDFGNGFKLVDLQQCDLDAEGNAMGHCVGDYNLNSGKRILSLRDARNKPRVTIEIENNRVEQIKGKQNEPPVEKYAKMIKQWLKTTDLEYKECEDFYAILEADEMIEFADDNELAREFVTSILSTPKEVLAKYANDENEEIKYNIAMHQNTPKEVLAKYANDENEHVRKFVAYNESTPEEVLIKLANDKDENVQFNVALNLNTPKEVLIKLANDENARLRRCVASNPNTPKEVLFKLANDDKDVQVRRSAMENPNF